MKQRDERRRRVSGPTAALPLFLLAVLPPLLPPACGEEVEELVAEVAGTDTGRRARAVARLGGAGAGAITPLASLLGSERPEVARAARAALDRVVQRAARPGAGEERRRTSRALGEALGSAPHAAARGVLLELLGRVGGAESVPAIAGALDAPGTHDAACRALARIPGPEATAALRNALVGERATSRQALEQVALLNALGARADEVSARPLADEVRRGRTLDVRLAALEALASNPLAYTHTQLFWDALRWKEAGKSRLVRSRIWSCLVRVGYSYIESSEVGVASDLFCDLLDAAASPAERCGGLIGLGHASRRRASEVILEVVEESEGPVRAAALEALSILRGPDVIASVEALLERADPAFQTALLGVLARRSEPEAPVLAATFLDHPEASVRAAALAALEGRASAEVTRSLIGAIEKGGPVCHEGAVGVLARLPGAAVTGAIRESLAAAPAAARPHLGRALALRRERQPPK